VEVFKAPSGYISGDREPFEDEQMSYLDAPATKMLATHCAVCGRSLVDARSVEMGIGPECRGHIDGGIDEETRKEVNALVHAAAIAAQNGEFFRLVGIAEMLHEMGLPNIALKLANRVAGEEARNAEITIEEEDNGMLEVKTPFRRGEKKAFIEAWRSIPGRRYYKDANHIPASQKAALWSLLRRFFPGRWAKGPKGLFRVPKDE
jgi:hypothetical protein